MHKIIWNHRKSYEVINTKCQLLHLQGSPCFFHHKVYSPNFRRQPFQFADLRFAAVDVWQETRNVKKRQWNNARYRVSTTRMFPKIVGFPPKSSHFNEFSIINHLFLVAMVFPRILPFFHLPQKHSSKTKIVNDSNRKSPFCSSFLVVSTMKMVDFLACHVSLPGV